MDTRARHSIKEGVLQGLAAEVRRRILPLDVIAARLEALLPELDAGSVEDKVTDETVVAAVDATLKRHGQPEQYVDAALLLALERAVRDGAFRLPDDSWSNREHTTCRHCGHWEDVNDPYSIGAEWTCPRCGKQGVYGGCVCLNCWHAEMLFGRA